MYNYLIYYIKHKMLFYRELDFINLYGYMEYNTEFHSLRCR